MIELKPINGLIAIELPQETQYIKATIHKDGLIYYINNKPEQIDLPPKTKWEVIGFSNDLTEEQLTFIHTIGERNGFTGLRYVYPRFPDVSGKSWISTKKNSFELLLESNGLLIKNKNVILKRIKPK